MTHSTRKKQKSHKSSVKMEKGGYDIAPTLRSVVDTALIPDLKVMKVQTYVFRYLVTQSIGKVQNWTTQMLLDEFAVSMGSGTARRIFNAIRLKRVEIWSDLGDIEFEFAAATAAAFSGAPRIPVVTTTLQYGKNKNTHLCMRPRKDELASKWFTAPVTTYTLFNCVVDSAGGEPSVLEIEIDAVMWNGDGFPYATSYSSASAAGTIGCGNFAGSGQTGMRIVGWSNLATP